MTTQTDPLETVAVVIDENAGKSLFKVKLAGGIVPPSASGAIDDIGTITGAG